MTEPLIRPATIDDAGDIADIYNHYVLETTATFDLLPKSMQERAAWMAKRDLESHPVLVAEVDGLVVGWGSLNPWGDRPGWRHTVEISVYVEMAWRSKGIGHAILHELLEHAEAAKHHAVIAHVVSENEASLRLSAVHGFERVGLLKEVGRKFDRWLDIVVLERLL